MARERRPLRSLFLQFFFFQSYKVQPTRFPFEKKKQPDPTRPGPVPLSVSLSLSLSLTHRAYASSDPTKPPLSHTSTRILTAVKEELARLTELAGVDLRPEVFDVLLELTRLNVVPTATAQVLKSLCTKSQSRASAGGATSTGTFVTAGTTQR